MKVRYYININDGRVIAGTEETKNNIFYKEIDSTWADAIYQKKVTTKEVISAINAKVGVVPFSEMMKAVAKMNVRTSDLKLAEHAKAGLEGEAKEEATGVLGEFKSGKAEKVVTNAEKKVADAMSVKL
jgi:hypothetical protein